MATKQTIGELAISLVLDTSKFQGGMKKIPSLADKANAGFSKLSKTIGTTLKVAIAGATVAMGAFLASTTKVGASFEKEVAILGSIRGVSKASAEGRKELALFEKKARELGASTAYSASEAVIGMQQLARAGLTTNEVISAIGPALKFAGASASDMESATQLLASSMKQFGLDASSASRITDAFTIIQQKSLFDMTSLADAMRYAGTVGASFGYDIEQTTSAVAMFRDLGLQGASAGVQFRMAMMRLAKPTAEAERVLQKYGITLDEVNPSLNSFDKIATRLAKANIAFPDITRIFSARASGSMSQIIEQFAQMTDATDENARAQAKNEIGFYKFIDAMEQGAGVTSKTYDATLQNLSGFTDIAKSAFQELQLTIFDLFAGPLMDIVGGSDGSGGLTGMFNNIAESINYVSSTVRANLATSLGTVSQGIQNNTETIGARIAVLIEDITTLVVKFLEWLPTIVMVTKALVTLFLVAKVQSFISGTLLAISGIYKMVPALARATAGARVFGLALQATNPIGWAVMLGTAIAGLALWSMKSNEASERTERYARTIRRTKEALVEFRQEQAESARVQAEGAKQTFSTLRTELDARGQLTPALENELRNTERLAEAQIREKLAKGELVKVTVLGEEALLSHVAVQTLAITSEEEYGHAQAEATRKQEELMAVRDSMERQSDSVVDTLGQLVKLQDQVTAGTMRRGTADLLAGSIINQNRLVLDELVGSNYDLENAMNATNSALSIQGQLFIEASREADGYAQAVKDAETKVQEQQARAEIEEKRRAKQRANNRKKQAKQSAEQRAKQIADMEKTLGEAYLKLQDKLNEIDATEGEKRVLQSRERVAKIEAEYDRLLALVGDNTLKRARLEAQMSKAILLQTQIDVAKYRKAYEKQNQAFDDALNERTKNALDEIDERTKEELKKAEDLSRNLSAIEGDRLLEKLDSLDKELQLDKRVAKSKGERAQLEETYNAEVAKAQKEFQDIQNKASKEFEENKSKILERASLERKDIIKGVTDDIVQIERAGLVGGTLQTLRDKQAIELAEFKKRIKGLENAEELLTRMETAQAGERQRAKQDLLNEFVTIYGAHTAEIDAIDKKLTKTRSEGARQNLQAQRAYLVELADLERELADVRANVKELSDQERLIAEQRILNQIEALNRQNSRITLKSLIERGKKLIAQARKIGDGIGSAFQKLMSGEISFDDLIKGAQEGIKKLGSAIMTADLGALFKTVAQGAKSALSAVMTFASGVASAVMGAVDMAQRALGFLTGGATLDPMSLIQEGGQKIAEAQKQGQAEKDALEQQLAKGEISQTEFDQAIASGVGETDASALGAEFVQGVVDNAINMIQAIASGAPAILQRLAQEIPILIDALVVAIPQLVETLATQLPVVVFALIDGIIELLPNLVGALVTNLPILVDGIIILLTEKLPQLLETLTPLVTDIVSLIVEQVPRIVTAIVTALPDVISFVVNAVKAILTGIPTIIRSILDAIPTILTELLGGVGDIIMAVFDAIPLIINEIILKLPDILTSLLEGLLGVIVKIAQALPILIAEIIKLVPVLIPTLYKLFFQVIIALLDAIPQIILGLVEGIPDLIVALVSYYPILITELIKMLPEVAIALVVAIVDLVIVQLPKIVKALVFGIYDGIIQGVQALIDGIKEAFEELLNVPEKVGNAIEEGASKIGDGLKEVFTLGMAETESFGDTPYAIKAGPDGMTANFAPRDYVIASQTKSGLLKQAVEAMGGAISSVAEPSRGSSMDSSMVPAMLQAMSNAGGSSQPQQINIAVNADGRLLDEITVGALDRGQAPRLEKRLTRGTGARVGLDRGRFNNY